MKLLFCILTLTVLSSKCLEELPQQVPVLDAQGQVDPIVVAPPEVAQEEQDQNNDDSSG